MIRSVASVLIFIVTLTVAAPAVAIAGVLAEGSWRPALLAVSGAMLAATGWNALGDVRETAPSVGGIKGRMLIVVGAMVVVGAAGALAAITWLLVGVFSS